MSDKIDSSPIKNEALLAVCKTVSADGNFKKSEKSITPLVGYVVIDEYEEGMEHWNGAIAYPNPEGATLYWENPKPFIEKSYADALQSRCAELETQRKQYEADCARIAYFNDLHDKYTKAVSEIESLRAELKLQDDANDILTKRLAERDAQLAGSIAANKILRDALKFYADKEHWTLATAQTCSTMIGPDDHYGVPNTSKYVAGGIASEAIAAADKLGVSDV